MNKILYHLHIPKTAGTSLREIITDSLPRNKVYPALLWKDVWELQKKRASLIQKIRNSRQYSFVSGHLGYDLSGIFLNSQIQRFTILREPVSRSLSFYNHLVQYPEIEYSIFDENGEIAHLKNPFPILSNLLNEDATARLFHNIQLRYIALDYDGFVIMKEHANDWKLVAPDFCH